MALIDKASLLMVPSTYEAGKLYNVLPSGNRAPDNKGGAGYDQTRADFDFDRGSNAAASRINSSGLIEKYRENLLLQSNSFDVSANWVNNSSTESSGFEGYDGTSDAWKLTATATSGVFIRQIISFSNIKTFSVYAKAGTSSHLLMLTEGGGNTWFDLQNGIIETDAAIISKMESVGNDWYRCSVTWNSSITGVRLYVCDADGTSSVANGGNIYIQSAQLESGLVATEVLTSGATTGKAGVLVDLPRINYDANGENGALLLEPSRSNSVPYSEGGFAYQTSTSGTGITPVITENAAISPEGVQNAFKVVLNRGAGNTSGDWSWIYQNNVGYVGSNVISVYLKAATSNDVGKEVAIRGAAGVQPITLTADWKRYTLNKTASSTSDVGLYSRGGQNADNEVSCFVYGFQVEQNATYPSSYIPNHGESGGVTRAADSTYPPSSYITNNVGNSGSWFMEYEDFRFVVTGTSASTNRLGDGSNANCLGMAARVVNNDLRINFIKAESGVVTTLADHDITGKFKCAFVWDGSNLSLYVNGSQRYSAAGFTQPSWSSLNFNNPSREGFQMLKQNILFDEALTQSEAEALTTL